MSQASLSPRAVERLRQELAELQALCSELQACIAACKEQLALDFEVVPSSGASSAAAAAVGADLPEHRVRAAENIGAWLRRCLNGQARELSGRETVDLPNRVYIVARSVRAEVFNPPKVFTAWSHAKPHCYIGNQAGDSIFVGFPSKSEARLALSAAGLRIPPELTRHR